MAFREEREGGWFRPHPARPWLGPAVAGDPGHVPARQGVAVDGKERKGAKSGGRKKVRLLAAVTLVPGIVIARDRVAESGKANEISHFRPLLAPAAAGRGRRDERRHAGEPGQCALPAEAKNAQYLRPVLGNQPPLSGTLNALPWEDVPVAARPARSPRGRIETRTIRVLPAPDGTGFAGAAQALLIERHVTQKKKGQWRTSCEAVLYLTSLAPDETTPEDLLAHVRGHWRLATRRDLERRQIPHPHRKRTPDLVCPHQPRHHPIPHTRSNRLHRRDPPQRPRPPPRTPTAQPNRHLTRLNTTHDFDESLQDSSAILFRCPSRDAQYWWYFDGNLAFCPATCRT